MSINNAMDNARDDSDDLLEDLFTSQDVKEGFIEKKNAGKGLI